MATTSESLPKQQISDVMVCFTNHCIVCHFIPVRPHPSSRELMYVTAGKFTDSKLKIKGGVSFAGYAGGAPIPGARAAPKQLSPSAQV